MPDEPLDYEPVPPPGPPAAAGPFLVGLGFAILLGPGLMTGLVVGRMWVNAAAGLAMAALVAGCIWAGVKSQSSDGRTRALATGFMIGAGASFLLVGTCFLQ